ncbi:MAG: TonB-dependent receptor [Bacteroidota bacterium]
MNQKITLNKILLQFVVVILFSSGLFAQQGKIEVSGAVRDSETGEGLPGVSVFVKGTIIGTSTDFDGNYKIELDDAKSTIAFSFIGYKTEEVDYAGNNIINISLIPDSQVLDEAVVVGFSKQKKISVTGSVTAIKPSELQTSSTNITNAFAGRMAGVMAVQRSGEPGSNGSEFWIRGISTFGANNTPLVFLDGVEIHAGGDLNSIDPSTIESFSVLKDASSTALYGARGANGVILITTKNGIVSDKPIVNVQVRSKISTPTSLPEMADAVTYMNMANEAVRNSNPNAPQKYSAWQIDGTERGLDPNLFPNVNWMDELFNQFQMEEYANVNIRGGGPSVQYFTSVSYTHSTGLIKEPKENDNGINFNRLNIQNNLTSNLSKTTKLQVNVNVNFESKKGPNIQADDLYKSVMYANPVQFPTTFPYQEGDDHIRFGSKTGGYWGVFPNPYARLQSGYSETNATTLMALAKLSQEIPWVKGLSLDAMVSVKSWGLGGVRKTYSPSYYKIDENSIIQPAPDVYEYDVVLVGAGGNSAIVPGGWDDGNSTFFFQPQINYNRVFGRSDIQALLVYSSKQFKINDPDLRAHPFDIYAFRNQGLAARISYMFDNKYMIETNMGYTGSENFAENHRFGFFPSISVGYAISNEQFFKDIFNDAIPLLKFRASYGFAGNDQIGGDRRFPFTSDVDLYEDGLGYNMGYDFSNYHPGVFIREYDNPLVTWETGEKMNFGIDLETKFGLNITADYFEEERTGIFIKRKIIPSHLGIGESDPYANIGIVGSHGIDIAVNYNKAFSSDLIVTAMGTFTYATNKILEFDEPVGYAEKYPNLTRVGRPVHQIYGLRASNIVSSEEEYYENPEQAFGKYEVGDLRYMNINDDDIVDDNDMVPMGYPLIPEINYGFGVSVQYKNFDASIFFQGVERVSFMMGGHDMGRKNIDTRPDAITPFTTEFERNALKFIADDYWTAENPNPYAAYPRLTEEYNQNNDMPSSWWLRDGSFLRLKDAEIGYKINKYIRVYAMGNNLLTMSEFKLWDPEALYDGNPNKTNYNGLRYPNLKSIALGLQFNL